LEELNVELVQSIRLIGTVARGLAEAIAYFGYAFRMKIAKVIATIFRK